MDFSNLLNINIKLPEKKPDPSGRPRVGHIKYLNCFPIYCGLTKNMAINDMDFIPGSPTELNQMIHEEKLDISPMSSIEYLKNQEKYLLCPHLSLNSNGRVKSILLISKLPIKKLDGERVSLTSDSSTSHVLLKIILEIKYGIKPKYYVSDSGLDEMLEESKAGLLIGDKALEESQKINGLYRYDLGEEWEKMTNKKMVYKVWCIRKEFVKKNPKIAKKIMEHFHKSYEYTVNNIPEIAGQASQWEKFNEKFVKDYLSSLNFSFDKTAREGLMDFYNMANEVGLVKKKGKLEFYK